MAYSFTLPALTDRTEEGVVVAWFKREGAEVVRGEPLVEVQMEKVSYVVDAPVSGRLHRILAPKDAVIRQGQVLALILEPGESPPE
jgi:pyruvate dehydrogenase E2 component (dihydrolipoamide acetyltransferase)